MTGPHLVDASGRIDPKARALDLVQEAKDFERGGCMAEAEERLENAITIARRYGEQRILADALRRAAVLRFHKAAPDDARRLAEQSLEVATAAGDDVLAAEALNTLANIDLQTGELDRAQQTYARALDRGGHDRDLRARVEQNLGVLANIHGDLDKAQRHYQSSLEAHLSTHNEHGCAIVYHNLGMVNADRELWAEAQANFERSRAIAERLGDAHLEALCVLNRADVHVSLQRFDEAKAGAERALALFDQLGSTGPKADAYRVIGMVYREIGRPALAESRLRSAVELSTKGGLVLEEAESSRELAILYQMMGRNQEALTYLNTAWRLFRRLDARVDLINVRGKVAELEQTYMNVVREWGQSIESSDSYTHGHCERVANYALGIGKELGLSGTDLNTLRIGAYLHDVGKVKVPHEILNKPGKLTDEEFDIMKKHTVWGVELLAGVEFPWDIKPIIRWHHEKADGSGYPDRLMGDEIPLNAQIIGIVDVFDALTTTRAYRGALSMDETMKVIKGCRAHWRPEVFEAFLKTVGAHRDAASGDVDDERAVEQEAA